MKLRDYTFRERIHHGTNATLYRGMRNSDGGSVVIKLPKSEYPGPRELAQLRHEYGILRELNVPGVVKTYGLESFERGIALILEDLGGEPLSLLLGRKKLDLKTFLTLASSLAGILAVLHERHILHKDIKPQNIFATAEGVCLIDFSLAVRLAQETQRALGPDALEGTLAYMSPEQTGRMNQMVDARSDLYSAGVTFYEMLTGELPFTGTDPMELVHSHIARKPVPPGERVPGLPAPVSDIVMKLLAKAAEDRYQTARGLQADLDACRRQLQAEQTISPFPLGQQDISGELHIPQKLYGRAAELAELEAAFERVRHGKTELLLVAGYSGVGKSALVHEIHKPIAGRGGYFISGKFDQYNRSVPYAPIARAFRDLFRQILTESPQALLAWKAKLLHQLGGNAQLLIDLIPEIELVIGPQPPVQPLGTGEAQNRFAVVFQGFLKVFCAREHPLVLFLDDLQWADAASMKLMQLSLTGTELGHLLFLGAYRDNEVDAAHPLVVTLDELRKAGASVCALTIDPLKLPHVEEMLATTLHRSQAEVEPLARLVHEKTQGNPFFISQLLRNLHKEGLLSFDSTQGRWRWDLEGVREVAATGNVVEFMVKKIKRLRERTQRALQLAACIGHRFELSILSIIHEKPAAEMAEALWEALEEGLVLPLQSEYRFLHDPDAGEDDPTRREPGFLVSYRFLHDRVQQAAYSLIDDAHKQEVHLKIGRLLRAQAQSETLDEQTFDIVGHLNRGAPLIDTPAERLALALLNLTAGLKAKRATAYEAAADYFAAGIALLSDADWQEHYELAFTLHLEHAQCEQLAGRIEQADALLRQLLTRARTRLHRTHVRSLHLVLLTAQGRFTQALNAARDAFIEYGFDLPESEEGWKRVFASELAQIGSKLHGRRPAELMDAPVLIDPEMRALVNLWVLTVPTAYFLSPTLFAVVAVKTVSLSLEHGNSPPSSYGYMAYGILLAGAFGRYEEAYEYGRLALALNQKFEHAELVCKLNELFGVFILFYRRPLRETLEHFERAYQAGLAIGDFTYLSYTAAMIAANKLSLGEELGELAAEIDRYFVLMQRTKDAMGLAMLKATWRPVKLLTDRMRAQEALADDSPEEKEFREALHTPGAEFAACLYYVRRTQILLLEERHADALAMVAEAERLIAAGTSAYYTTELPFYKSLILTALYPSASPSERAQYDAELDRVEARLSQLAEGCAENFRHKLLLVQAERARLAVSAEAVRLYDQAIEGARTSGFLHEEALANELCGKFYLSLGTVPVASFYLTAAHAGYVFWGAAAKVAQFEQAYGALIAQPATPVRELTSTGSTSRKVSSEQFDMNAVFRAAQTIAGEIVLPKVVDRMMRIVLTNAGAQRGILVLSRGDRLFLEATLSVNPERVELGIGAPLEGRTDLPLTVIHYVARTREPVVLADAASDARFASDPKFAVQPPKSVLCLPLLHQGRLTGMLYLEHGSVRDVFTPTRVELLGLLAAQTAIALENAALLSNVEVATLAARRANEKLEGDVARRTAELREANQELSKANDRLQIELAERNRAEQERAALQEHIIAVQEGRIAEMATPFLPITDEVMVMPIIGVLDSRRAEQIIEVALNGAQGRNAQFVILDITGLKSADTQVADILIRTAKALRLLGTEAILTGLRAEIAQTVVMLGIDLSTVTTRSTLQSAMAYALGQVSRQRRQ